MKFDRNEFEQCIPTSDSNRLMLAQWGAWGLTNLLDEQGRYNDSSNIFSIEKLLQIESKKLRVKKGEDNFYVKNDNRIRY